MSRGASIRAGKAYVELATKNNLTAGLRSAEMQLKRFGSMVTGMGRRLLTLGAGLGAPLLLAAKHFADAGSDMLDLSQRTGMTVEALSELKFAAEQSGSSMEELEIAIKFMQRGGFGRGADDLERIADELAAMTDPAQRTARALEIFGRSGTRMLPMLINGAEGVRQLRRDARDLGLTMSTTDAQAAEAFGDSLNALWSGLKRVVFTVGAGLAPTLKELAERLTFGAKMIGDWISENRGLVKIIGMTVASIVALGVGMMVLGPLFSLMGAGIGLIAAAFTGLGIIMAGVKAVALMMWASITTPVGIAILALDGLRGALVTAAARGSDAVGTLGRGFRELRDIGTQAWGGIAEALADGDLQGAMEIAGVGLQTAWSSICATMTQTWSGFRDEVLNIWDDLSTDLAQELNDLPGMFTNFVANGMRGAGGLLSFLGMPGGDAAGLVGPGFASDLEGMVAEGRENDPTNQNIESDRNRRREARQRERDAAAQADRDRMAGLRANLQGRMDFAAADRAFARQERDWQEAEFGRRLPTGLESNLTSAASRLESRGTSSAFAIAGLGASSVTERIAENTRRTADAVEGLAQPAFT